MSTEPSNACRMRTDEFRRRAIPLPGSVARDNPRPMSVGPAHDRQTLRAFLLGRHPHLTHDLWQQRAREGRLRIDGRVVGDLEQPVRAGNQLVHTIAGEIEPEVSVNVTFIHEDDALVVLSKPAPLAVHPCGRYNRNALVPLLVHVFGAPAWHPVHRLDADTTGLLVLAKTRAAATHLGKQFEARTVHKEYLARVRGIPAAATFSCELPLTGGPGVQGKRAIGEGPDADAAPAFTTFAHLATWEGESLISATPRSGRTNQIRVHLAALGLPIVGDQSYGAGDQEFTSGRSNLCLHAWRLGFRHPTDDRPLEFVDQRPAFAQHPRV